MKINVEQFEGCWEITLMDNKANIGIIVEKEYATMVWSFGLVDEIKSMRMPDEFFNMIKDECKLDRPEIVLPSVEEVRELPWE